jgi:hypothetical protein
MSPIYQLAEMNSGMLVSREEEDGSAERNMVRLLHHKSSRTCGIIAKFASIAKLSCEDTGSIR